MRLDLLLALLAVVFTFVLASFAVYNTDFYEFLAVGRLIAHGQYQFGQDPFTFTSDSYWVNNAWLFDVGLYGLRSLPYGAQLVVIVKAMLLSVAALVMLATARQPGTSLWLPVCCVLLAILAASPRFILQPACVSMLFLALTVWLLRRPLVVEGISPRSWWFLPPLCALWVNVDQWFVLGPLMVGLFLLGGYLQRLKPTTETNEIPSAAALRTLVIVFLACLAACFLSPHHYHIQWLPETLPFGTAANVVAEDDLFRTVFATPWDFDGAYFRPKPNSRLNLSTASLAYFPLLLLCLVSFLVNKPGFRWWRALVTGAMVLLSGFHGRAIPFFAIVAGPVTALNFVDATSRYYGLLASWNENQRRWALSGRVLTAVLCILLVVVSIPGWLQAKPTEQRRFGFDVVTDESLRHAVERLATLKKDGRLPDDTVFNTSPEIVHYFAWFGEGRGFMDQRLSIYGSAAEDYLKVRRGLSNALTPRETDKTPWRTIFTDRKVRIVVFHATNLASGGSGDPVQFITMAANPDEWTPLFLEGGTAIFAWNDPTKPGRSPDVSKVALNLIAEGYGPKARHAPDHRAPDPEDHPWYESLWRAQPRHSVDADEAQLLNLYYEARREAYRGLVVKRMISRRAANLVTAQGSGNPFLQVFLLHDPMRPEEINVSIGDTTACLYVALRAARRALDHDPNDARTHLLLGRIYFILYTERLEDVDFRAVELLGRIRRTAAVTHLRQAVELDPNLTQGHLYLFEMYKNLGMMDMATTHFGEYCAGIKREGPNANEKPDDFVKRVEDQDKKFKDMEKRIAHARSIYNINAPGREPPQKRALLAFREVAPGAMDNTLNAGLAETALKAYQELTKDKVTPDKISRADLAEVLQQWIDLLFDLGLLTEVRKNLDPELKEVLGTHHRLGVPAYDWFEARLAAASGDYDEAIEAFTRMADGRAPSSLAVDSETRTRVEEAAQLLGQAVVQDTGYFMGAHHLPADVLNLFLPRRPVALRDYTMRADGRYMPGLVHLSSLQVLLHRHVTAQLQIIPGWLAVEAGQTERAEKLLEKALRQRQLVERGLGRTVALPLAMLASSNARNFALTWFAVEIAYQDRPDSFHVERLGWTALLRLRGTRTMAPRP